jgi:hypothetical protein
VNPTDHFALRAAQALERMIKRTELTHAYLASAPTIKPADIYMGTNRLAVVASFVLASGDCWQFVVDT